jgi:hypothetical protein
MRLPLPVLRQHAERHGMAASRSRVAEEGLGHQDRARAEGMRLKAPGDRSGVSLNRLYVRSARQRAQPSLGNVGSGLLARVEVARSCRVRSAKSQRLHLTGETMQE